MGYENGGSPEAVAVPFGSLVVFFYNRYLRPSADMPQLYFWLMVAWAISIPLSPLTTSIFQIALGVYWLFSRQLPAKIKQLLKRADVGAFLLLYALLVVGMLYTTEVKSGLRDLELKLPLIAAPLIIATSPTFSPRDLKIVFLFLAAALFVSFLISFSLFAGLVPFRYTDLRELSIFISHIRLSLMINLSIFSLLYMLHNRQFEFARGERIFCVVVLPLLFCYMLMLKVMTGLVIFALLVVVFVFLWIWNLQSLRKRHTFLGILLLTLTTCFVLIYNEVNVFFEHKNYPTTANNLSTQNGEPYLAFTDSCSIENGYYVDQYIAPAELSRAWNSRSTYPYELLDDRGQALWRTLQRYMSSKGLRKDSAAVMQLSISDIRTIESGAPNVKYLTPYHWKTVLYEILWPIDNYIRSGNPNGQSTIQRLEYWRAGVVIFRHHWWMGVGTGGVSNAFQAQYEAMNSKLEKQYRHNAHNQYLTVLITFGVPGFVVFAFAVWYPIVSNRGHRNALFLLFLCIALVSMINEDTLETQAGVTFFAFYYSLFLFGWRPSRAVGQV